MKAIPMAALALMLMAQQSTGSETANLVGSKALVKSSPAPLSKDPKHVKSKVEVVKVKSPEEIAEAAVRERLERNISKWIENTDGTLQPKNKVPTTRDGFKLKVTLEERRNPDKEYGALCYAEAVIAAFLNQGVRDEELIKHYVEQAVAADPSFNSSDTEAVKKILPPYLQAQYYIEKDVDLCAFHKEQLSILRDMRDGIAYEFKVVKCEIVHKE